MDKEAIPLSGQTKTCDPVSGFASRLLMKADAWCAVVGVLFALALTPPTARAESDPFEGVNRVVFEFNNMADRYLLKPVAQGYDAVTPTPVRIGVTNFFGNLRDVNAALNALLQGKLAETGDSTGRFLINSTLGFLGFFDVATDMGIPRYQTDFGYTLARWGIPEGSFVVLPLLGPRTIRSGIGTFVDGYASPQTLVSDTEVQWALRGFEIIDIRAGLLGADRLISGDPYAFTRDAYLQRRNALVNDGKPDDGFSEFDDSWEDDGL